VRRRDRQQHGSSLPDREPVRHSESRFSNFRAAEQQGRSEALAPGRILAQQDCQDLFDPMIGGYSVPRIRRSSTPRFRLRSCQTPQFLRLNAIHGNGKDGKRRRARPWFHHIARLVGASKTVKQALEKSKTRKDKDYDSV